MAASSFAKVASMFAAVLPMATSPSRAADICKAVALRDVAAIEAPDSILRKGETDTAITQYRVNKKTKAASFCSHGGYCYPASGLKLLNCKIGGKDDYDDPEEVFYGVDVVRSKVPAALLRYDDLDNRLLSLGLCNACASNAADAYLKHPASACGRTVRAALEGNPGATKALNESDVCN